MKERVVRYNYTGASLYLTPLHQDWIDGMSCIRDSRFFLKRLNCRGKNRNIYNPVHVIPTFATHWWYKLGIINGISYCPTLPSLTTRESVFRFAGISWPRTTQMNMMGFRRHQSPVTGTHQGMLYWRSPHQYLERLICRMRRFPFWFSSKPDLSLLCLFFFHRSTPTNAVVTISINIFNVSSARIRHSPFLVFKANLTCRSYAYFFWHSLGVALFLYMMSQFDTTTQ